MSPVQEDLNQPPTFPADLLQEVANTIRGLAMDAVQRAESGHPGMPMGMADVATVLWTRHLRYSIEDPQWPGRDRFVLSAGHGSMLQYALLHLSGYPVSLEDLERFRQLDSNTPGHPELGETVGVEITTGPLGSGFASAVGMALGAKMEAARFANPHYACRVIGICSDGDLMEGVAQEAGSLAGHLGLDNLTLFYDDNRITIDGSTELSFSEDVAARFDALGWRVLHTDGHDLAAIRSVMDRAFHGPTHRPTLVVCRTHIGFGSPGKQDSSSAHGAPLGAEEVARTKEALGLPAKEFFVPDRVRNVFATCAARNESLRHEWLAAVQVAERADPERAAEHAAFRNRTVPGDLLAQLIAAAGDDKGATRALSGKVIQRAAALVPSLVGGSADLDGSCKTSIKASRAVARNDYGGRVLHFGVREHGMGAILNGLALHGGYLPMGSTFLVFSDYMRASLRLAALMQLRVGFVFTHDSLMVGEDGPTHQPIEQVSALRLIPNLHVWRPAGGAEVAAAWHAVLTRTDGPVALCLTRQDLPALPAPSDPDELTRGGYVVRDPAGAVATLVATGSEVPLALATADLLATTGAQWRVVSMPCMELFLAQPEAHRRAVLGALPVWAVEMGRPELWCQVTGSIERVIGIGRFGKSAPAGVLADHFGFTPTKLGAELRRRGGGTA